MTRHGNAKHGLSKTATYRSQVANTRNLKWFRAWNGNAMCLFVSNDQHEFAKRWGLNSRHISNCLENIQKTHKDWKFQWII